MTACSEYFLYGNDFDDASAIFRSYCYREKASEAVKKIAADETDYHKCSLCSRYRNTVEIEKVTDLGHITSVA